VTDDATHVPREADDAGDSSEPDADEQRLFDLLDDYVGALHRLDATGSGELRARNPEHDALLRTLESLDKLAPIGTQRRFDDSDPVADADPNATTIYSTGTPDEAFRVEDDTAIDAGSLRPGEDVFDRFELLEELGRGGMGVVYRARQTDLGREVAIKMILSNRLASREDVRRFRVEARTAASITHPNVVGIHEVGEHRGQSFFTMDYVRGPSLANKVSRGPLDPHEAARLLAKLARAVHHLHENGIVHRDLKPSNVLVDEQGEPRLTDFGLAKLFEGTDDQTRTGTILGTASYMAPEQAAGRLDRVGPRTDVYGLGAILYELLTGRPPFREEHPLDTLVQVLEGEPERPTRLNPLVPADLETICRQCLEKEPDQRYASAAALADDLEHFLREEPIEAGSEPIWRRARRWARRQPALVSRLVCIVLAAGIVQGRYFLQGGDLGYLGLVMSIFAAWAVASSAFQWLADRPGWRTVAQYGWISSDVLLETIALFIMHGTVGPIVMGYPLVVAAAGLFYRIGLVAYAAGLSIAAYTLFVFTRHDYGEHPHYAGIFCVLLAVQGFIVAYQVHRVRILSRYYGERVIS
jgi:eukaryotic-like serine/threonine-protein kinase